MSFLVNAKGQTKPTILPKNKRTNSGFLPNSTMSNSFVRFLEEFEDNYQNFVSKLTDL